MLAVALVLAPALAAADPAWDAALAAQKHAEAEHSARAAVPRWEAAGRAFDAVATVDAAFAGAQAWDHAVRGTPHAVANTVDDAEPLDDHELHILDDTTRFFALGGAADPRAADVHMMRATTWWRRGHFPEAELDLGDLVRHHADVDAGARAAEMLLDGLNRMKRYDDLHRWVVTMRATTTLATHDAELGVRLLKLELVFLRRDAESAAEIKDYARCVALYDRVVALAPHDLDVDEALYDATVCAESAHDPTAALAHARELMRDAPGSKLADRARERIAAISFALGDFAGAADADEQVSGDTYLTASDSLNNAIQLRTALGQDAAADADLARAAKLKPPDVALGFTALGVVEARSERGATAAARRAFDFAAGLPGRPIFPDLVTIEAWQVACPVVTTDYLCLVQGVPVPREPHYMALALDAVRRAPPSPITQFVVAAAAVEAALAGHDTARDRAATDTLAPLVASPDDDVSRLARAMLDRVARHAGQPGAMSRDLAPTPRVGMVAPGPEAPAGQR